MYSRNWKKKKHWRNILVNVRILDKLWNNEVIKKKNGFFFKEWDFSSVSHALERDEEQV